MFKQTGVVDFEGNAPDDTSSDEPIVEPRATSNFPDGIFARLPNSVALDRSIDADGLVYVAARLTWADQKGAFRASDGLMKQIGMGRERARKARVAAKGSGYLLRYQPHKPARGEKAAVAIERLTLPPIDGDCRYRLIWRSWFDRARRDVSFGPDGEAVDRIKCLAAFLYINAMGGPVFSRELAERFEWSRPTAAGVLAALRHAGVVEMHQTRDARGRIASVRYSTVKKLGDGFLVNGNVGGIRNDTLDEASPKHPTHERYTTGEASPTSDWSDDKALLAIINQLKGRDRNRVIASSLWRDHTGFAELVARFGADAVTEVIKVRLVDAIIDGRASGSIRSLRYFCGALEDDKIRREMEFRGERPGDILGAHRRCAKASEQPVRADRDVTRPPNRDVYPSPRSGWVPLERADSGWQ